MEIRYVIYEVGGFSMGCSNFTSLEEIKICITEEQAIKYLTEYSKEHPSCEYTILKQYRYEKGEQ